MLTQLNEFTILTFALYQLILLDAVVNFLKNFLELLKIVSCYLFSMTKKNKKFLFINSNRQLYNSAIDVSCDRLLCVINYALFVRFLRIHHRSPTIHLYSLKWPVVIVYINNVITFITNYNLFFITIYHSTKKSSRFFFVRLHSHCCDHDPLHTFPIFGRFKMPEFNLKRSIGEKNEF